MRFVISLIALLLLASGCYYNPGDVSGSASLSECLGVPATIGIGWKASEGSTIVAHQGTSGDDVVVIAGGPVQFDGRGGDDLICVNRTTAPTSPLLGVQPTVISGGGGNDTIVNFTNQALFTVAGGAGNDVCVGVPASSTTSCQTDPHPGTGSVVDSFGDVTPWDFLGVSQAQWEKVRPLAWNAVSTYHDVYAQPADCDEAEHSSWWTVGPDHRIYPSWHPHKIPGGCAFGHEHGFDPRLSPIYGESEGVPFGYANEVYAYEVPGAPRHEDHAGHKVVVQTGWEATFGNAANLGEPLTPAGITCNWLSKVHQGTWSADALAMNLHEYQLNLQCTGRSGSNGSGTDRALGETYVHVTELMHWGDPGELVRDCDPNVLVNWGGGSSHPSADVRPDFYNDGKREIACFDFWAFQAENHRDLWKPDGRIYIPQADGSLGASVAFSPYYAVFNPARAIDKTSNTMLESISMCFDAADNWIDAGDKCSALSPAIRAAAPGDRLQHVHSPFNGTVRGVAPKSVAIFNANPLANGPGQITVFCTSSIGEGSVPPPAAGCDPATSIEQRVGPGNNWDSGVMGAPIIAGSAVNGLVGSGNAREWFVYHPDEGVHAPN